MQNLGYFQIIRNDEDRNVTLSQDKAFFSRAVTQTLLALSLLCTASLATASGPVSFDDPWEKTNRAIFSFNDNIDTYALKPVAKGYDAVTPKPVQQLVSNFFSNLGEVRNAFNAALQLKGKEVLTSIGRFGINSSIGMLGLVDVATPIGLEQTYEDFGLTLAHWGTPSGPYVVLPFLGPRTVRSGVGILPDSQVNPIGRIEPQSDQWLARGVDIINIRSSLLGPEGMIIGDRYSFIRDAYLQRRQYQITGELPEDDF